MRNARVSASLRCACLALLSAVAAPTFAGAASALESRSFAVSYLTPAMHSEENDCPGGPNPRIDQLYSKYLSDLGFSEKEIVDALEKTVNSPGSPIAVRGRIDGRPVNAFQNPASVKDIQLKTLTGKFALGFNLDGKGAKSPNSFVDPETLEQGVNNQLARSMGCIQSFRAKLPDRPTFPLLWWEIVQESTPVWLITVTGEDLDKDGDVTIIFDRALEHPEKDANSEARADMTYRIDPNPISHNIVRGTIKDGLLTSTESIDFRMQSDPMVNSLFEFRKMKLRAKFKPDGGIDMIIGGYMPWERWFFSIALNGNNVEYMIGTDFAGVYWTLRRLADADPDPATGLNTTISAAYSIQAVPAFVVPLADAASQTLRSQAGQ